MRITAYNREEAVYYAKLWAFSRNPKYYNFDKIGGDCTNFVSQCIFAGASVMNYTPVMGWYYNSVNDRTPSWAGVDFLYNFLTTNKGYGPFGKVAQFTDMEIGDVIQLGNLDNNFYHSLIVTSKKGQSLYVSTHTFDSLDRPLNSYYFEKIRHIKIEGVRK